MTEALDFLIRSLSHIVLLVVLLRFWLPVLRADFRNPVAQGILRITAPIIVPVRRLLPAIGRIDTATLVVALVIELVSLLLILLVHTGHVAVSALPLLLRAVLDLAATSVDIFFWSVLIAVLLSWFPAAAYHPAALFVRSIAEPVLRPFRRLIPPMGGFDISPIFALIIIQAIGILVRSA